MRENTQATKAEESGIKNQESGVGEQYIMTHTYENVTTKPSVCMLAKTLGFKIPADADAKTQTYHRKFTVKLKSPANTQQKPVHRYTCVLWGGSLTVTLDDVDNSKSGGSCSLCFAFQEQQGGQ